MSNPHIFVRADNTLSSLESLFGWHSQYERMVRWHEQLKADASLDVLLAFFLNCYALRDWLHNHRVVDGNLIDAAVKANFAMNLCRDLCNRSKHLILTKPAIDANFHIVREYRGENRPIGLIVLAAGRRTDLKDLATDCLTFWQNFLIERGLITQK